MNQSRNRNIRKTVKEKGDIKKKKIKRLGY